MPSGRGGKGLNLSLNPSQIGILSQLALKFHELEKQCHNEFKSIVQILETSAPGFKEQQQRQQLQQQQQQQRQHSSAASPRGGGVDHMYQRPRKIARRGSGTSSGTCNSPTGDDTPSMGRRPSESSSHNRRNKTAGESSNVAITGVSSSKTHRKGGSNSRHPNDPREQLDGCAAPDSPSSFLDENAGDDEDRRRAAARRSHDGDMDDVPEAHMSSSTCHEVKSDWKQTKIVPCRVRGHGLTNHNPKVRKKRNCSKRNIFLPHATRISPGNLSPSLSLIMQTAYIVLKKGIEHGTPLECSHEECRKGGSRFAYCSVCDLPVAIRNFWSRHVHYEVKEFTPRGGGGRRGKNEDDSNDDDDEETEAASIQAEEQQK